jgi:hypothetical protein
MSEISRRGFLGSGAALAAPAWSGGPADSAIDFRYSPLSWQTAYCFPDDHAKSLVGERGELRYGHPGLNKPIDYFPVVVEFSLAGMEADRVTWQKLEAPGVPIVHTLIERPEAYIELTAFATDRAGEGRVDNVILEVRPRVARRLWAGPQIRLRTQKEVAVRKEGGASAVHLGPAEAPLFLATAAALRFRDDGHGGAVYLPQAPASADRPLRHFFRFPQQGQTLDKIRAGLAKPEELLGEARDFWRNWKPFGGGVSYQLAGRHHEFLLACARNIQQAREVRDGRLTFQVGPTVYRGLWVVDGHFILEAARYLGYDAEAQQGLETTWSRQAPEGNIYASGGRELWKDTGIALFSLVRQAELSQDWNYFRKMQPQIAHAAGFLRGLRDKARAGGSTNGRYGLLAPGLGDGGIGGGARAEFTNTVWVLAGLRAVAEAAERQRVAGLEDVGPFYRELRQAFFEAARREMRPHPAGFEYLPMLMRDDPQWAAADDWDKPRPQSGQWALSHAIFPGLVFEKNHPVVRGHIALMQACTQEDIPTETGWLYHGGAWTYNAPFAAHVYLWAEATDWARLTFNGFLNHASPLYCWREEQPLRGSLVAGYIGDMPHNWASAECVLYLRHMLALEDGAELRLLAGIGDTELAAGAPYNVIGSPTRFGRVNMQLEPLSRGAGWRLKFERGRGPQPARVRLPALLASGLRPAEVRGADARIEGDRIVVAPDAASWEAVWKRGA